MSTVQDYIDSNIETFREQLFDLLRIPSVSTDSIHKPDVKKAGEFLKNQLSSIGLDKVTLHETAGHPIVTAEKCPHENQPTVLIYGHYDVQPPDPENLWDTPPFEPTIKDNRVYARGSSDDKGQSFTHVKDCPLSSLEPRAYTRLSLIVGSKGGVSHRFSGSGGCTS